VQVEQAGLLVEGVVVEFDDPDAAFAQRLDDLLHLGRGHDEVAVDGGLPAAQGLKVDRGGQPEGGR
jgi:hypothetical protein